MKNLFLLLLLLLVMVTGCNSNVEKEVIINEENLLENNEKNYFIQDSYPKKIKNYNLESFEITQNMFNGKNVNLKYKVDNDNFVNLILTKVENKQDVLDMLSMTSVNFEFEEGKYVFFVAENTFGYLPKDNFELISFSVFKSKNVSDFIDNDVIQWVFEEFGFDDVNIEYSDEYAYGNELDIQTKPVSQSLRVERLEMTGLVYVRNPWSESFNLKEIIIKKDDDAKLDCSSPQLEVVSNTVEIVTLTCEEELVQGEIYEVELVTSQGSFKSLQEIK